jgi:predicted metal-dependent enzyme (double-stranded beta helix superfamily)
MIDESSAAAPHGPDEIVAAVCAGGIEVSAVAEAVARLARDSNGLERALGADDRCGITVLATSRSLTIQRVVWPAGIRVPPHDHRMWAVVGVYRGREDNALFRRNGHRLDAIGGRHVQQGEVLVLDPDAIHAVANSTSAPCVALHVYGGDLDGTERSAWTPDEQRFDPDAMWQAIARFRRKEDELGRALTAEETASLMPNR